MAARLLYKQNELSQATLLLCHRVSSCAVAYSSDILQSAQCDELLKSGDAHKTPGEGLIRLLGWENTLVLCSTRALSMTGLHISSAFCQQIGSPSCNRFHTRFKVGNRPQQILEMPKQCSRAVCVQQNC